MRVEAGLQSHTPSFVFILCVVEAGMSRTAGTVVLQIVRLLVIASARDRVDIRSSAATEDDH